MTSKNLDGDKVAVCASEMRILAQSFTPMGDPTNLSIPATNQTYSSVAATDVISERMRQLSGEGYSLQQDDGYLNGELRCAAITYIEATLHPDADRAVLESGGCNGMTFDLLQIWPWQREFFKPKSIRQDLVKAAALLIAEIERIDRAASLDAKIEETAL